MAEQTSGPKGPQALNPAAQVWKRISPRLVPVLAVLTALLITIPFMIFTGGGGSIVKGLHIAGTAYSALIEGSVGLAINDRLSRDDLAAAIALAENENLTLRDVNRLVRPLQGMAVSGMAEAQRYGDVLGKLPGVSDDDIKDLGGRITDIQAMGTDTLEAMRPLIADLGKMSRGDVRTLADPYQSDKDSLTADERAALNAAAPSAANLSDADALRFMKLVNDQGIVKLQHDLDAVDQLKTAGIDLNSADAATLVEIAALQNGAKDARDEAALAAQLTAVGIDNPAALKDQLQTVVSLYNAGLFTNSNVKTALDTELNVVMDNNLVVRRPDNTLVIDESNHTAGIVYSDPNNTPADSTDDKPSEVYLKLGGSALLFFPENLEKMIVRSIPFIVAGLAVALGFKAGLFNIGAEGQLYAGSILAVWVGFSPFFANLPTIIHVPLELIVGILGGALWGAIPGVLKAFAGAHEVINTIMLNFVAVLLVDWLIKPTGSALLLDTTASTERTPFIVDSARLPLFTTIPTWLLLAAGFIFLVYGLYRRRDAINQDLRFAIRPVFNGVVVIALGLFLSWITVNNKLNVGFLIMLAAVWFTGWFLTRTTPGFELRTVGENSNAARYAGMNVKANIILALALSGALAGLAGTIEITGVQFNMQPAFFSGLGFDAIAVALLARSEPRNMIAAGLLWGGLLTGAGLVQLRADISIDLVKIIQALIIMFIAADAIIRYLWRVPKAGAEEKSVTSFAKGWGG
jgi:general nucleoside transport system permease protein